MGLVDRAKNILLKPKEEWQVIAAETPDTGAIIGGYMVPLVLLQAAATIVGMLIVGSLLFGVATAVMVLIASVVGVLVTAAVINALAPSFQSEQNFGRALQLVVYANTAAWVGGLLNIIPVVGGILAMLVALYGIYLLYLGFTPIMKTPQDKVIVYMIVAVIALMAVYFILMAILGAIFFTVLGVGAAAGGAMFY